MTPFIKGFPFLKTPKTGVFLHSFSFFITTNYKDICQSTSKSTSSFLVLTQKMNNGPPNIVHRFFVTKEARRLHPERATSQTSCHSWAVCWGAALCSSWRWTWSNWSLDFGINKWIVQSRLMNSQKPMFCKQLLMLLIHWASMRCLQQWAMYSQRVIKRSLTGRVSNRWFVFTASHISFSHINHFRKKKLFSLIHSPQLLGKSF